VVPAREPRIRGDYWVRRFFDDLLTAVRRQTGLDLAPMGFCDVTLPIGSDRMEAVQEALAAAKVFVPLYSPTYLARSESLSELESFRRKLIDAGQSPDGDHVLPILWSPLRAPAHQVQRRHALAVADDIDEYADNGMSALCRMDLYRAEYSEILGRLARRIDSAGRHNSVGSAAPRRLVEVTRPEPSEVPFLAAVIAPTAGNLPAGRRNRAGYGFGVEHWRPFPADPEVVGEVTEVVERLSMHIEVREFVPDPAMFSDRPGMLLVDPWILATESGAEIVRAAVGCLQPWASVVIILDGSDPQAPVQGRTMVDEVRGILDVAAPTVFTTAAGWRRGLPEQVDRMRRRFLSQGPSYPPKGPVVGKPRLDDPGPEPARRTEQERTPDGTDTHDDGEI
jgi:FxsC-like protein